MMLSHHAGDGDNKARSPGRARRKPLKPFACGRVEVCSELSPVVPAHAGTHNHRAALLCESRRPDSFKTMAAAYGSLLSLGRRKKLKGVAKTTAMMECQQAPEPAHHYLRTTRCR